MIKVKDMVVVDFSENWYYTPAWVHSIDGNNITIMFKNGSTDMIDASRITLAADVASYLDCLDRDDLEMGWCPF